MNCTVVQNRLLSCDRPDLPPVDLKGHLVTCPICRAWHRRLVRLEQQLPQLPVPVSTAKEQLLRRVLAAPAPPLVRYQPRQPLAKERGLQKLAFAFASAAAMVLFAAGWWAWHRSPPVPRESDRLVQYRQDLDRRLGEQLARAGTPRKGVESMADLADELHREAVTLAQTDDPERLAELSHFYARVVREQLLPFARRLSPTDRPEVLTPLVERLARAESRLERFAAQTPHAEPLRAIAAVARDTAHDLQSLSTAGTSAVLSGQLVAA